MSIPLKEYLPQGSNPPVHQIVDGILYRRKEVFRDLLTGRAYFDAVDIQFHKEAIKRYHQRAARNPLNNYMQVNIHVDMLDFSAIHRIGSLAPAISGGGLRGAVRGFSRASRKRMIEFMAKARIVGQLLFATFTYPDMFPIDDPDTWHAHFEALRRRIERKYPDYRILWRAEYKRRKSGANFGMVAPHYHFMIDTMEEAAPDIREDTYIDFGISKPKATSTLSREFETWSLQAWSEIVGSGDVKHSEHGCFTVACRNRRHAYHYISKYVAKIDYDDFEVGRRWGRIGQWDTSVSGAVILTKIELIELKRMLRKWMKSKGIDYRKFIAKMPIENGFGILGIGDGASTGKLFELMLNHAADLAGSIRPFGELLPCHDN